MVVSGIAVVTLFVAAAMAHGRHWLVHALRGCALLLSLALGWQIAHNGAAVLHLYRWLDMPGRVIDASLHLDGTVAAVVVLTALFCFAGGLLSHGRDATVAAAMDVAAAGVVTAALAADTWLALAGCEVLLIAAFVHGIGRSLPAPAVRRLLFLTRAGSAALVGSVVFAHTSASPWLALLATAVLVGAWPFHSWFVDLGEGAGAATIRLLGQLTGVSLLLSQVEAPPPMAPALLLVSATLASVASLSSQRLLNAQVLLASAQGALLLAAVSVDVLAVLLLLPVFGLSQIAQAGVLARLTTALPDVDLRLSNLGGLASTTPWWRWLALCSAAVVALSPGTLWAAGLLAGRGQAEFGVVGAVAVAVSFGASLLPLARLALAPYSGPVRHTTTSAEPVSTTPRWVILALLPAIAGGPAAVAWWLAPPVVALSTVTLSTGIGAGAIVVSALAGWLCWRGGPRPPRPIEPPLRQLAAEGFAITSLLHAAGGAVLAGGRFLWTLADDVLFSGVTGLMGLGVRLAGWALAWLHDGWSGWALATATGTAAIVLWAMFGSAP